ncbi:MAG TPA: hypothetical protein VFW65_34665 [Pseudonocardiaceae bacterium]|nr:hypothetical protein [Pseudonocardiaceae bacterium]
MAATGPLQRAVTSAARQANLGGRDRAALALAKRYAADLDNGGDLDKLGPRLLAVLDALVLTPKALAAITKGVTGDKPTADPVDELRSRRAARQHGPASVDQAAP